MYSHAEPHSAHCVMQVLLPPSGYSGIQKPVSVPLPPRPSSLPPPFRGRGGQGPLYPAHERACECVLPCSRGYHDLRLSWWETTLAKQNFVNPFFVFCKPFPTRKSGRACRGHQTNKAGARSCCDDTFIVGARLRS
jgi:hypothetical protein